MYKVLNEEALTARHGFLAPFGAESCENEVTFLQEEYQKYYYSQAEFSAEVVHPETYLIVGRRGSGKSSLAKFLEFQQTIPNARCIDVNEPDTYDDVFRRVTLGASRNWQITNARIAKIWTYLIWSLIFHEYQGLDPAIHAACLLSNHHGNPARLVADILKQLFSKFIQDNEGLLADEIEHYFASATFAEAQVEVLKRTRLKPMIIAIDTLERYSKEDELLMQITAALIESAANFNVMYAHLGLHLKVFVGAEIFPHIKESAISNTTKFIRQPVYLHWRPKDMMRLLCWRFYRHLEDHKRLPASAQKGVAWHDFNDVITKMWFPFFGESVINDYQMPEASFSYILRHTQMRPRQFVILCNKIARRSMRSGSYPEFKQEPIAKIVQKTGKDLADEVLNAYDKIYPQVNEIVDALKGSPMIFRGNFLDKMAKTTIHAWPSGVYSPANFRKLVAELGIVGCVRSQDDRTKIVEANFEYTLEERLPLQSHDTCVIHPMFYAKLQTNLEQKLIVYPSPDHRPMDEDD